MNKQLIYFFLFIFNCIFIAETNSSIKVDTSANSVFDDFNEVKSALTAWNNAINNRSLQDLEKIYDTDVLYYLAKRSSQDCIKSKLVWLQKRPLYSQKIKNISIYTIGRNNEKPDIVTEFKKDCYDGVTSKEYDALLVFRKVGNSWRLIKETDMITEVKRFYNLEPVNLNDGKYIFVREYFKYNYDKKADTTQLLSYKNTLEIAIEQIPPINYQLPKYSYKGKLSIFSGAINSLTEYVVLNGSRLNGILELTIGIVDADQKIIENTKQTLRFKIIDANQIVLLNKEMPWLYGKPMSKY